jgi:ubiquinone/menaquinone biosynthesis C-methylase UbiE
MSDRSAAFEGSIPEIYDQHLGPVMFPVYATDLAGRISVADGGRVLEMAGGTGISTRKLRDILATSVAIVATDLNEPMLEVARKKFAAGENITFQPADATSLPFEDGEFDAVICQFGVMFFPDKAVAFNQVMRVLKPGGAFAFNVWDDETHNPAAARVADTIMGFLPEGTANFFKVPFGFNDEKVIRELLQGAGFVDIAIETRPIEAEAESAVHLARGFVQGNPIVLDIRDNPDINEEEVVEAVAAALREIGGDNPMRATLQAKVITARRPD